MNWVGPDASSDLTILKLNAQDARGRSHVVSLNISSQYPSRAPTVSADVPLAFKPHWNFPGAGGTLLALVQQFERWLFQFDPLWTVLEEVDAKCWVLEPEKPTRACTYRRVVIGKECICICFVLSALNYRRESVPAYGFTPSLAHSPSSADIPGSRPRCAPIDGQVEFLL